MKWLRLYTEALDDPKVQRLPDALFKTWVNLLLLAGQQERRGTLPPLEDIAFRLRLDVDDATTRVLDLVEAGLLEDVGEGCAVHGWERRQPRSDNAAERMRELRRTPTEQGSDGRSEHSDDRSADVQNMFGLDKKREEQNRGEEKRPDERDAASPLAASAAPAVDVDGPAPWETETVASLPVDLAARRKPATPKATRIPAEWGLTPDLRAYAAGKGLADPQIEHEAEAFRAYWSRQSKGNVDWVATWQSWILRRVGPDPHPPGDRPPRAGAPTPLDRRAALEDHVQRLKAGEAAKTQEVRP